MKAAVLAILVVASATAACGKNSQSTSTTAPSTLSTETFSGLVGLQGSNFYSFTVSAAGTVDITLASLMANSTGPASAVVVGLGLGNPVGTGCSLINSVNTAAALTTQLTSAVSPDVYCVQIQDVGNMTVPLNFTIRIKHP
ncbi:MAG: hypothetical protein Q7J25_13690 [Vicinamibacterales bacterium]|nr:hypothetical protein [Vicinamibacterales bacterium]